MFDRQQEICIGYMSGASNVTYWLKSRHIEPSETLVKAILAKAKESDHILSDEELEEVLNPAAMTGRERSREVAGAAYDGGSKAHSR